MIDAVRLVFKKISSGSISYNIPTIAKIISRITEKGRMDKMFGIEGLDKKWASISKKKVKKADNISQRRLGIKEDIEYIEINRD